MQPTMQPTTHTILACSPQPHAPGRAKASLKVQVEHVKEEKEEKMCYSYKRTEKVVKNMLLILSKYYGHMIGIWSQV